MPFPTPGDLPDLGVNSTCLASPAVAGRFLSTVPPGKPPVLNYWLGSSVKNGTGQGGDFLLGTLRSPGRDKPAPPTLEAKS